MIRDCESNHTLCLAAMSARQIANESSEEEYFSVRAHDYAVYHSDSSDTDEEEDIQDTAAMPPPRHPVPSMQGAFEESIYESWISHSPVPYNQHCPQSGSSSALRGVRLKR